MRVGDPLGPLEVLVTAERVRAYADASGDHNPIHLDEHFAATTPFGGTIAHGMLLLAYLSRVLSARFGPAWAQTGALDARFRAPARVGSRIVVQGTVESVEAGTQGRQVECALRCLDEAGQALVTATARLRLAAP